MKRTLGQRAASVGAGALVTLSALVLTPTAANATEYGNHNYLGILSAQPPTGFPVSPAALDLSSGPATITVGTAVTNLTNTTQVVPMDFSVHRILTYQGQDVSDGQPGQPGLTFPPGSAALTTQVLYGTKQTGTFTVPASGSGTISFTTTISACGYYQIDFNHWSATLKKMVLLASGFTRALGCETPQLAPRLTPGFWKNHQAAAEAELPQRLGGYQVTTFTQVTDIFSAMKCSSPANCLAAHLLAAQFDVSSGSSKCIAGTITAANAFLQSIGYAGPKSYSLTSAQAAQALSLESTLDAYTNDSTSATC
jgi:hypothetical protein